MAGQTGIDSQARQELARTASTEIMALTAMLGREHNSQQSDMDDLLRGSLIRLHDLSSVIISVTGGDDGRETSEMRKVMFGN
jgi:hypothetical protein